MPNNAKYYPFPISEMERMFERSWIFNYLPKNSIGAEIGVFRGHFSELLLSKITPKRFYMVDPWTKIGPTFGWGNREYTAGDTLTTAYAKYEAECRTKKYSSTEIIVVEEYANAFFSNLAQQIVKKEAATLLDFIYLDASHNYEATYEELAWADKVLAPNGFIAGDDWHYYSTHVHHGVFRAVHRFLRTHDYKLIAAGPGKQYILCRTSAH